MRKTIILISAVAIGSALIGHAGVRAEKEIDYLNPAPKVEIRKVEVKEEPVTLNIEPKAYSKVIITLTGSIAAKLNNPCNLRYAGQPNAKKGKSGFASFPNPELGFRACIKQIELDQSRKLTLAQFITKFAPPVENDTKKYISFIEEKIKMSRHDSIEKTDSIILAKAVAEFESQTRVN
ncbi:MAG: hypothetical protein WCW77_00680 [Patescibacteria group bacterium]